MDFFDLVSISKRFLEIANPSTPEKLVTLGKYLKLQPGHQVLDFGCGFGESLAPWEPQGFCPLWFDSAFVRKRDR